MHEKGSKNAALRGFNNSDANITSVLKYIPPF